MMEVSKTSRSTAKRFFTRSENALHQALDTEALEETVMRRFNDYKRRWEIAQEAHDKYIEELGTVTEDEIETEDLWLNELAERFYNLEVRVDNTLHERKEKNTVELNRAKEELISKAEEELDKGPFKKYVTVNIPIFDPLLPSSHTFLPFTLTPLPLVIIQIVANFLTLN